MTRSIFCLALALGACGDDAYDLYAHEPDSFRTATLWVDPHHEVPAELARQACEAWRPEGVLCELAPDPMVALVRIHMYPGPCEKNEDGSYTLGYASVGGDITLMIECLHRFGGMPIDEDLLWPTIAHEVGHELGIWMHIPPDEGVALMNPKIHEGLYGITVLDHEAYLVRDADRGVLRLGPEGCTLTTRE